MNAPRKHPLGVTLLLAGVLSLTASNGVRFGAALASREALGRFAPSPAPLYIAITGLIWLLTGLPLIWGLWFGSPWARRATLLVTILYMLYYWLDRLAFQYPLRRANWPFSLALTLFWLIFTLITLLSPGSLTFFKQREQHDRKS